MAAARRRRKGSAHPRKPIPPPPPFWRHDRDCFWGMAVLAESDDADALPLWRAARLARTFAETGSGPRLRAATVARLEQEFAAVPPCPGSDRPSLEVFARVLRADTDVGAFELAEACEAVSTWAHQTWRPETAIQFAELAARVDPAHARRANAAGRLCRDIGLLQRATLWFQRGFRLAIQGRDPEEAVRAQLGYGALLQESGRLNGARAWYIRAARRAARTGRKKTAAETRHDLMALDAERGRFASALEHAELAAELYPLYHQRLPYLAHDFAFALLQHRHYREALTLLETFARVAPERYLLPGLATLGWAAAGCGAVHRYEAMESRVLSRIAVDPRQAAPSLILLAQGARQIARWDRAEQHARNALDAAGRLDQPRYARDAGVLLDHILSRRTVPAPRESVGEDARRIARHLVARLRRWKPRSDPRATDAGQQRAEGAA